jgi:hypothetical protein
MHKGFVEPFEEVLHQWAHEKGLAKPAFDINGEALEDSIYDTDWSKEELDREIFGEKKHVRKPSETSSRSRYSAGTSSSRFQAGGSLIYGNTSDEKVITPNLHSDDEQSKTTNETQSDFRSAISQMEDGGNNSSTPTANLGRYPVVDTTKDMRSTGKSKQQPSAPVSPLARGQTLNLSPSQKQSRGLGRFFKPRSDSKGSDQR